MKTKRIAFAVAVIVAIAASGFIFAQHRIASAATPAKAHAAAKDQAPSPADQKVIDAQLPGYPLKTCVVTGEKMGGSMGKAINYVYKGQLVRFCCKICIKAFNKNPDKYLAKIDKARAEKGKSDENADANQDAGMGCCGGHM